MHWFDASVETINPDNPLQAGESTEISRPMIADDTMDPALKDMKLPTIDDLREVVKPGVQPQGGTNFAATGSVDPSINATIQAP